MERLDSVSATLKDKGLSEWRPDNGAVGHCECNSQGQGIVGVEARQWSGWTVRVQLSGARDCQSVGPTMERLDSVSATLRDKGLSEWMPYNGAAWKRITS